MCDAERAAGVKWVALRKESVDRNTRRKRSTGARLHVALRKESVDRNTDAGVEQVQWHSRSPQGERG